MQEIESPEELKASLEEKDAQLFQEKLICCNIGSSMLVEVKAWFAEGGKTFGCRGLQADKTGRSCTLRRWQTTLEIRKLQSSGSTVICPIKDYPNIADMLEVPLWRQADVKQQRRIQNTINR